MQQMPVIPILYTEVFTDPELMEENKVNKRKTLVIVE